MTAVSVISTAEVSGTVPVSESVTVVVRGEVMAAEADIDVADAVATGGSGLLFREPTASAMMTRDMPQNHAAKKASR